MDKVAVMLHFMGGLLNEDTSIISIKVRFLSFFFFFIFFAFFNDDDERRKIDRIAADKNKWESFIFPFLPLLLLRNQFPFSNVHAYASSLLCSAAAIRMPIVLKLPMLFYFFIFCCCLLFLLIIELQLWEMSRATNNTQSNEQFW